jgi:hypothetical protein
MKLIDPLKHPALVKRSLSKYSHFVEHHFEHYLCIEDKDSILSFADCGKGRGVLLSTDGKGKWRVFPNGVLALPQERYALLEKLFRYLLLKKHAKKVVLEVDERFRSEILDHLSDSKKFKALSLNYLLYWPVFHMELFDSKMKGRKWKKLRNIRNRFQKQHRTRMVDARNVPTDKLEGIVMEWMRRRRQTDVVSKQYYLNAIRSRFKGFTLAKVIYVDGEPCTITAGWEVKNGEKHYYSAIGLLNYAHLGIGEFANLMDLLLLKKKGYRIVDFGGSGASLLGFKSKFRPHAIYKTYVFSVVKR